MFGSCFDVSYVVKVNLNVELLWCIELYVVIFDVFLFKEVEWVLVIGCEFVCVIFFGLVKWWFEIEWVIVFGVGEFVLELIVEVECVSCYVVVGG